MFTRMQMDSTSPTLSQRSLSSPSSSITSAEYTSTHCYASNGTLIQQDQLALYEFLLDMDVTFLPSIKHSPQSSTTSPSYSSNLFTHVPETIDPSTLTQPKQEPITASSATSTDTSISQQTLVSPPLPKPPRHSNTTATKKQKTRTPFKPSKPTRTCTHCNATETPTWRRSPTNQVLCNACGVFQNAHGVPRPLSMKKEVVHRRKRGKQAGKRRKSETWSDDDEEEEDECIEESESEVDGGDVKVEVREWDLKHGG